MPDKRIVNLDKLTARERFVYEMGVQFAGVRMGAPYRDREAVQRLLLHVEQLSIDSHALSRGAHGDLDTLKKDVHFYAVQVAALAMWIATECKPEEVGPCPSAR
jgi:hypothetical protein